MAKQAFQLLDTESGNVYTLETEEDILLSNLKILLPSVDGKLALVKDVEDLSGKISRGDITVADSNKLGGKTASEYADKNLSNVELSPGTLDSLRGYTGSQGLNGNVGYTGSQGPIGIQGNTGYTGSQGIDGNDGPQGPLGYTGSKGDTGVLEKSINVGTDNVLNLSIANLFVKTLTANTSFSIENIKPIGETNSFILEINNVNFTITWWNNIKWANGIAPILTSNGTDILGFYSHDGGLNWRGMVLAKDSK